MKFATVLAAFTLFSGSSSAMECPVSINSCVEFELVGQPFIASLTEIDIMSPDRPCPQNTRDIGNATDSNAKFRVCVIDSPTNIEGTKP